MKFDFKVTQVDHGFEELRRTLEQLKRGDAYAKAGVLGEKAAAVEHEGGKEPLTNVQLMVIHEFGAPAAGIPERPVIRRVFDANRAGYLEQLKGLVRGVYERRTTIRKVLEIMGFGMKMDMKAFIREGQVTPPQSEATYQRKLKKTRKGSTDEPVTLIDTGTLVRAIDHAVVLGGQPAPTQVQGSAFGTKAED